jgi:hypothetical protein
VRLAGGKVVHRTNSGLGDKLDDATSLGPEEFFVHVYANMSSFSYQATRNDDNRKTLERTEHAAHITLTPSNTPKKYPGLDGLESTVQMFLRISRVIKRGLL